MHRGRHCVLGQHVPEVRAAFDRHRHGLELDGAFGELEDHAGGVVGHAEHAGAVDREDTVAVLAALHACGADAVEEESRPALRRDAERAGRVDVDRHNRRVFERVPQDLELKVGLRVLEHVGDLVVAELGHRLAVDPDDAVMLPQDPALANLGFRVDVLDPGAEVSRAVVQPDPEGLPGC